MSTDIDSIKRKLLIKYPTFGSVIANIEFQASKDIETVGTDGKVLLYNPKFLDRWNEKQQMFLLAHEICHVAFDHIYRSEGKDKELWNNATDSVINALLQDSAAICVVFPPGAAAISNIFCFGLGSNRIGGSIEDKLCK